MGKKKNVYTYIMHVNTSKKVKHINTRSILNYFIKNILGEDRTPKLKNKTFYIKISGCGCSNQFYGLYTA